MIYTRLVIIVLVLLFNFNLRASSSEILIACTASFYETLKKITPEFEKKNGVKLIISNASSGTLFHQIINGAPFDVFLAADEVYPKKLVENKLADPNDLVVYATGELVLLYEASSSVTLEELKNEKFWGQLDPKYRVGISNPELTPYGKEAINFLTKNKLLDLIKPRLIYAESVLKNFQLFKMNHLAFAFVPLSQVINDSSLKFVRIPLSDYNTLKHTAVVINRSKNRKIAQDFIHYLIEDQAVNSILLGAGFKR